MKTKTSGPSAPRLIFGVATLSSGVFLFAVFMYVAFFFRRELYNEDIWFAVPRVFAVAVLTGIIVGAIPKIRVIGSIIAGVIVGSILAVIGINLEIFLKSLG